MADTLTIKDNRTGKEYEVEIKDGAIPATSIRQIKVQDDDFGLLVYDPAFKNTASCRSAITLIDGDKGILRYRGYPIEQLAEKSTYLEVAYLLVHGELPGKDAYKQWEDEITHHTYIHQFVMRNLEGFKWDAHAMGKMVSLLGTLSTFYNDSKQVRDEEVRKEHVIKIIAKMPTLAAWCFRHGQGKPYIYPDNNLSYVGNFMNMLFRMAEPKYEPNPIIERALDVLFILHADHEQNCSANAARSVGSAESDPYCSLAAATAALYGPLHGRSRRSPIRPLIVGMLIRLSVIVVEAQHRTAIFGELIRGALEGGLLFQRVPVRLIGVDQTSHTHLLQQRFGALDFSAARTTRFLAQHGFLHVDRVELALVLIELREQLTNTPTGFVGQVRHAFVLGQSHTLLPQGDLVALQLLDLPLQFLLALDEDRHFGVNNGVDHGALRKEGLGATILGKSLRNNGGRLLSDLHTTQQRRSHMVMDVLANGGIFTWLILVFAIPVYGVIFREIRLQRARFAPALWASVGSLWLFGLSGTMIGFISAASAPTNLFNKVVSIAVIPTMVASLLAIPAALLIGVSLTLRTQPDELT